MHLLQPWWRLKQQGFKCSFRLWPTTSLIEVCLHTDSEVFVKGLKDIPRALFTTRDSLDMVSLQINKSQPLISHPPH